ncbi:FAD-dependent oxidoreductase [Rhodococcus erythropolis]|uniref:flavin-containing monooxygenase n=1 Tax=Rhodococcus erythropolis TaxID=1833 RepID=UPI00294A5C16|nr:FAD-dependent oxidoreductase [Rhodococcus erythropolis]MDV6212805.1 FAD-dependent oxidoreductase [Rhodococcus erythropolis]
MLARHPLITRYSLRKATFMTETLTDPTRRDLDEVASNPAGVALGWLGAFEAAAAADDIEQVLSLFDEKDCWWRDMLTLTWDLRTMHGLDKIRDLATGRLASVGYSEFKISTKILTSVVDGVLTAAFDFRGHVVQGRGIVRLRHDGDSWKAWTFLTKTDDLVDFPELQTTLADATKPKHTEAQQDRESWYEFRERQREFRDREPDVVVVGAGHAGLNATARLQHMGLSTLLLERTPRIGDVWRQRYHNLALHDTKWYGQMPYLKYPDNWPLFAPKELLGDWFEAYVWILQLNAWTSTEVKRAEYDEDAGRWTVELIREGQAREVHPKYVVFATGAFAGDPQPPTLPGRDQFRGRVVHSSAHEGGEALRGKRVVVVGTGSSAHDVAQDACEMGAEVTMVQRGPTYVVSTKRGVPELFRDLYSESSPENEESDLIGMSFPWPLFLEMSPAVTRTVAELDAELLEGLAKAGFRTSLGTNDSGLFGLSLGRGGGYYINKGCSDLIIEGRIRIQQGEVSTLTEDGVIISDGTELPADVVVFATGWPNMRDTLRPIVGDDVADQLSPVWGLDDEGELRGIFRPSGHPRLWCMAGGFQQSRYGSKLLAVQVKAIEEGLAG